MELIIDEQAKEEIDYIINNFVSKFKDEVTQIESLAWCLDTLVRAKEGQLD